MSTERQLHDELERLLPDVGEPDWGDVLDRAGARTASLRRRALAAATALCATGILAVATPLGSAIAHGVGDFSSWLTGQPGDPVSAEEQRAFDEANARSWLGFPAGTQLRRLATTEAAGTKVELLGFRSGETMCLRVVASGTARGSAQSCAPLRELRTGDAPAHVVLVDRGFGRGTKREWYGPHRVGSSLVQVTAGIAADDVRSVALTDEAGRHSVPVTSNSFLYVAHDPDVGQRVRAISAVTASGSVPVPFAPTPFGLGGGAPAAGTAPGPDKVERVVEGGSIGWLDRREPRGEPIDVVPEGRMRRHLVTNMVFGRVLAPPSEQMLRIAVTLNVGRQAVSQLEPSGVCTWLLTSGGGGGGGCSPRETLFATSPITLSTSLTSGSQAFLTANGLVSDDVARLAVFITGGEAYDLPFADNAYAARIARAKLPARIVAYGSDGAVIGFSTIEDFGGGGAGPARGEATSLLKAESPNGSTAELLVGPSTSGGECMYIKYKGKPATGTMTSCTEPDWRRYPVLLNTYGDPGEFVMGQVRPDLTRIEIGYADGTKTTVQPTRGYVLYEIPAEQIAKGKEALTATGFDGNGERVATWSFRPKKRP
jgi:hypothetical protein